MWGCEGCGGVCSQSWWTLSGEEEERYVFMNLVCGECGTYSGLKAMHERKVRSYLARVEFSRRVLHREVA